VENRRDRGRGEGGWEDGEREGEKGKEGRAEDHTASISKPRTLSPVLE